MDKCETQTGEVLKTDSVGGFIKSAPQMMSELTQSFISKKGLHDRAKFRLPVSYTHLTLPTNREV